MKKYAFFKYFIKNKVFAGGVRVGLGVQFLPPIWFGNGGGGGCMEAGAWTGILKPTPYPPRCHVYILKLMN